MTATLGVWLGDRRIADVHRTRTGGLRCTYTEEALRTWRGNAPVISCSLPLQRRPRSAEAFLEGLLPEGQALDALASLADVAASDTYALLARHGRDIAGALVLSEDEPAPGRHATAPYDDVTLGDAVRSLDTAPLAAYDDSELSIAGLQDKLLLVRLPDGRWARPLRGHPSTHILKADSAARPGLVAAEEQCLQLAREIGLTTIETELIQVGAQDCLIVSRYDRRIGGAIRRVHQEDLCQATGRTDKYESRGRGAPTLKDAAGLLERYAADPLEQLRTLLAAATFTFAIGNADAHGKNLSFLHDPIGEIRLAPLYDTVPTILWSRLRTEMAMSINRRFSLLDGDRQDLVDEARSWPMSEREAEAVVGDTLQALRDAVRGLDPGSPVARTVAQRVDVLLRNPGATPGPPPVTVGA